MSSPALEELDSILADRLDAPPTIFLGLTTGELVTFGFASLVGFCVVLGTVAVVTGMGFFLLGVAPIGAIGSLFVIGKALRSFKRGRPHGYVSQSVELWLNRRGIKKTKFILPDGPLAVGRTRTIKRRR